MTRREGKEKQTSYVQQKCKIHHRRLNDPELVVEVQKSDGEENPEILIVNEGFAA